MDITAVDTSVAVPLLVVSHPSHRGVQAWAVGRELALSGHALAETYSVLTRLPGDARLTPGDAVRLIDDNFARSIELSDAAAAHRTLAAKGIAGGAVYDGIVALAALGVGVPLATRDARARSTYEALGVSVDLLSA